MSNFAKEFAKIQAQDEERAERHTIRQMQIFLSRALCCQCGQPFEDDMSNIIMTEDSERTIHRTCEEADTKHQAE